MGPKWIAIIILLLIIIAIIVKTEAHTKKTEPGYQRKALADFHATSARTKIIPICNLIELYKIDSN